jgi:hypothetical protein
MKLAITADAAAELKLPKASAKQLADFAEQVLGLDGINYRLGGDEILSRMRTAQYDKDFIEVAEEQPDIQRREPPQQPQEGRRRRMATVLIGNQDTPGGADPVPSAVNGKQMFTPRNKLQTIPWAQMHALMNARKLVHETDEIGRLKPNPSEAQEYPVSVVHEDPEFPGWDLTDAEWDAAVKNGTLDPEEQKAA